MIYIDYLLAAGPRRVYVNFPPPDLDEWPNRHTARDADLQHAAMELDAADAPFDAPISIDDASADYLLLSPCPGAGLAAVEVAAAAAAAAGGPPLEPGAAQVAGPEPPTDTPAAAGDAAPAARAAWDTQPPAGDLPQRQRDLRFVHNQHLSMKEAIQVKQQYQQQLRDLRKKHTRL